MKIKAINKKLAAVLLGGMIGLSIVGCGNSNSVSGNAVSENVSGDVISDNSAVVSGKDKADSISSSNNSIKDDKVVDNSSSDKAATSSEDGTPVALHGELSVKGTDIVDKDGNPYQIKGVSTAGIGWFPQFVDKEGFRTMRDEWGINCIRIAMYSGEGAGYCTGGNQASLKQLVENGVEYATDLGLYVIIDWHVLGDLDPNVHKDTAKVFFEEMSAKYADYDNVIYEICNEPNGGTTWASVKSYAEEVIPIIKANNEDAIIVVGTPTWSQDVDIAAANPIKGYSNIMYTIHFYADTHRDSIRQKMLTALNSGIPVFCTEFGICNAAGDGSNNKTEGETWIATMDANNVSYCIWNLSNKAETSSLIASGCSKTSGWTENELTDSAKWYIGILGNGVTPGSTAAVYENSNNNAGDNNNSGNNNNNTSATPVSTANSSNTEASIAFVNSWSNGTTNSCQCTLTVKNTGSSAIKDWKVTVNFGTNVTLDQAWNGTVQINGANATITAAGYNNEISAGGNAEVGFIINYTGDISNASLTIN